MTVLCDNCSPRNQCTTDKNRTECKYYQPQTNEEWLHTLNTEQLAEAILQQWIHGAYRGVGEFGLTDKEIECAREDIVEWLKQPHNSSK